MLNTNFVSTVIPALPKAMLENIIFPNLSLPELAACSRVCKVWTVMAKKHISAFSYEKAFGPKEWYTYFRAHLRNVPRLPSNIAEIMNSPCPFWTDKKIYETHVLVLVPGTVSKQPLNLKVLGEIVQKPLQGYSTKYNLFNLGEYVDQSPHSHWALLTRTEIEGTRNKTYEEEHALLDPYSQNTQIIYEIPTVLDAAVCNFMEYVRSGIWLHVENPWTYMWCQEMYDDKSKLVVGSGSDS
jgi:hypothetical protein